MRVAAWTLIVAGLLIAGCHHVPGVGDSGRPDPDAQGDDASSDDDTGADGGVVLRDANVESLPPFPIYSSWTPAGNATFFIGNSFTYYNDMPFAYQEMNEALGVMPFRMEAYTIGGYTFVQDVMDMSNDATGISQFLVTGTPEDRRWDVVVMQEQSETPGFGAGNMLYDASLDAASTIAAAAGDDGIILYVTWGHELGDPPNMTIYPDFTTMETKLERGYRAMAARLTSEGRRVRLAPVGPAFARFRDGVIATGGDPSMLGSAFDTLYQDDQTHPTGSGSYLAACVILSTITGIDPVTLPDAPSLGLDADTAAHLRLIARDTLLDPSWTPTD